MTTPTISNPRHFTLPTLLIFILVFTGAIFFIKPLWLEVSTLSLTLSQKENEKTELALQVGNYKNLQTNLLDGSEVSKEVTLNAIPERFEQDEIILDLQGIAQKNDVLLNSLNFNLAAEGLDKIKKATMNINLTGDQSGLISFLKGIETNDRKMIVKAITIQSGETDFGIPRVNFNLNIETYYQNGI